MVLRDTRQKGEEARRQERGIPAGREKGDIGIDGRGQGSEGKSRRGRHAQRERKGDVGEGGMKEKEQKVPDQGVATRERAGKKET